MATIPWIPVKTCLPLRDCIVAVVVSNGATTMWCQSVYIAAERTFTLAKESMPIADCEVTHWALLELPGQ